MNVERWTDERLDLLSDQINQLIERQRKLDNAMLDCIKQQGQISNMIDRILDSQTFLLDSQSQTNDVVEKEQNIIERQQDIIERQETRLESFDETLQQLNTVLDSTNAGVARLERIVDYLLKHQSQKREETED